MVLTAHHHKGAISCDKFAVEAIDEIDYVRVMQIRIL